MLGVVRAQQALRGARASGNAHLCLLNSLVSDRLRGRAFGMSISLQAIPAARGELGVSSFGFSGTIAASFVSSWVDAFSCTCTRTRPFTVFRRKAFAIVASADSLTSSSSPCMTPPLPSVDGFAPLFLVVQKPGSVMNVELVPLSAYSTPFADNVADIAVEAAGLNFRDVLNILDLDPTRTVRPIGIECAGTVLKAGPAATHLQPAASVLGMANGCLSTFVRTDASFLVPMPPASPSKRLARCPYSGIQ